jgi:hypothetical protein
MTPSSLTGRHSRRCAPALSAEDVREGEQDAQAAARAQAAAEHERGRVGTAGRDVGPVGQAAAQAQVGVRGARERARAGARVEHDGPGLPSVESHAIVVPGATAAASASVATAMPGSCLTGQSEVV